MTEVEQAALVSVVRSLNVRIEQLEKALMPFAVFGAMLDNVHFDMIAGGTDPTVPPGGTWYMTKAQVVMQSCHVQFKLARSALGAEKTNQYILAAAAEAAEQVAAMEQKRERDAEGKRGS